MPLSLSLWHSLGEGCKGQLQGAGQPQWRADSCIHNSLQPSCGADAGKLLDFCLNDMVR